MFDAVGEAAKEVTWCPGCVGRYNGTNRSRSAATRGQKKLRIAQGWDGTDGYVRCLSFHAATAKLARHAR